MNKDEIDSIRDKRDTKTLGESKPQEASSASAWDGSSATGAAAATTSATDALLTVSDWLALRDSLSELTLEVENGLRFVHQMEVQGRIEQSQLAVETSTLVDLLIAKGVISAREFNERTQMAAAEQEKREVGRSYPMLGDVVDKYQTESPDIPCAELLPLCRAACCNLAFSLSLQDLDEGVVRWNYAVPYQIRQNPETGKCNHFVTDKGCSIYECRPAVCRSYDCRNDERIWKDYEKRIPADTLANLAPVPAVSIDD